MNFGRISRETRQESVALTSVQAFNNLTRLLGAISAQCLSERL